MQTADQSTLFISENLYKDPNILRASHQGQLFIRCLHCTDPQVSSQDCAVPK